MYIARRLFVIPLADNDHGKTSIMNGLLTIALGSKSPMRKGSRNLISPNGRIIDAYVYVRSYQETEKPKYKSVAKALIGNDPDWKKRELIILPSHVSHSKSDIDEMLYEAHGAGFDAICAAVLLDSDNRLKIAPIWRKQWDERWTVPNPSVGDPSAQLMALGSDLWARISKALIQL